MCAQNDNVKIKCTARQFNKKALLQKNDLPWHGSVVLHKFLWLVCWTKGAEISTVNLFKYIFDGSIMLES